MTLLSMSGVAERSKTRYLNQERTARLSGFPYERWENKSVEISKEVEQEEMARD